MKRKWYVIKNNITGEYYDGSSDDDCWSSTINLAYFFYDKSDAEHEKDVGWNKYKFNDDCEIIELCEDDEEYQELKEYNEKLKHQLAEKDKEIDKWKKAFELSCNDRLIKVRHQVCDMIAKKAHKEIRVLTDHAKCETFGHTLYTISDVELAKIAEGESK